MKKYVSELYAKALAIVLDYYGLTEFSMFRTNRSDAVHARTALIVLLSGRMNDSDLAECTQMKRNSVCGVRNKYRESCAPWDVKECIAAVKSQL